MGWSGNKGWNSGDGWYGGAFARSPSYVSAGVIMDAASGNSTISANLDIGTASASRVILIAATRANGPFSSVTVNGVSCTSVTADTAGDTAFWACAGAAPGSGTQTISLMGGIFENRAAQVWVLSNLTSTAAQQTANSGGATSDHISISVTAADFLFAVANFANGSTTYSGSTQTPSNVYNNISVVQMAADWAIAATNPSFTINTLTFTAQAVVSYR
jgi:hypothetical protein